MLVVAISPTSFPDLYGTKLDLLAAILFKNLCRHVLCLTCHQALAANKRPKSSGDND